MTKFNLREAIAKNKATFFSSLNENISDTAEKFAKHMSKKENRKFTVTPGSVDEKSFDLDIDGLEYEGGSYLIDDKGDIINVSMGNKVYGNINQLEEEDSMKNEGKKSWYMEPEEEDYNGEDYGDYNDDENMGDGYIDDTDSEYDTGVDESKKSYYRNAEADDAEHIKALEKDMKDDKKSSKMKKSELKAKIKEMVLAEMNLDIQDTTSEYDFLAEKKEDEEDVEVEDTEVDIDGMEDIDVDTTGEVDPDVKAVQDLLTQAQAAAQALGDEKLTDQIGNTITFFTRTHVVDKGAVAEELNEAKSLLFSFDYDSTDEDNVDYIQGLLKDARVDAIAQPGFEPDEMVVKAKNEVELRKAKKVIQANGFKIYKSVEEGKEMVNEDLSSSLTILLAILIGIPGVPIAGALIMGLINYLFSELPDQRAEAKSLRSYKGPDKQEKVLALAKEIEAKLSPGKKRYLKTLVNRIGASKLEDKAREYRELDRYASSEKSRMDRGLNENLKTDIESALEDLPIPTNMEEGKEMVNEVEGKLVDEKTGEEVTLPYKTLDFRGNPITVVSFRAPHKSSSTGRIYTKDNREYFPGVAGLKIIDHSFSENLNESMFPMLKKILK